MKVVLLLVIFCRFPKNIVICNITCLVDIIDFKVYLLKCLKSLLLYVVYSLLFHPKYSL